MQYNLNNTWSGESLRVLMISPLMVFRKCLKQHRQRPSLSTGPQTGFRVKLGANPKPFNWSQNQPIPVTLFNSCFDHSPPNIRAIGNNTHVGIHYAQPVSKFKCGGLPFQPREIKRPQSFVGVFAQAYTLVRIKTWHRRNWWGRRRRINP